MKIGYLTGQYPRATDTFIQREIAGLRNLGLKIQTFSVRQSGVEHLVGEEQKAEYEQTFYLLPPNLPLLVMSHIMLLLTSISRYLKALKLAWDTSQPGLKGLIYQIFYFAEAGILGRQIQLQNLQHIHNHIADSSCTVAMLASELSGIPFSFTVHGPYIFFEPKRWSLTQKIQKALFVACISDFCRSQCMLFSPINCWKKLYIVHCGIDPSLFELVTHNGLGYRLLYVGRLANTKGLPILIESLTQLKDSHPDLCLTLVGDGEDRHTLEKLVSERGLSQNVKFVGYKSQTEVRAFLKKADIFVLPSFAEGVPVSLMEAMAAGVPVISTQIAGISELIENGQSGYLIPPGNVEQLSDRIKRLYADPDLRQSFGEVGRGEVTKEFNVIRESHRLSQIFQASLRDDYLHTRLF